MNPGRILALWRERWGKADKQALKQPYLEGNLTRWGRQLAHSPVWLWPGVYVLLTTLCAVSWVLILSLPLPLNSQITFAVLMGGVTLYLRRYTGTLITLTLIGLSFMATTRYLYWRFSASLGPEFNADFIFGFALCVAELYVGLLTALAYVATLWPVTRAQAPLPAESMSWPSVDVFIPCHDQPPEAILAGAQSALALDWPRRKIHIYLLDDAPRDDIHALAEALGVVYLAHAGNADGRAGQINRALLESKGELIAIFDGLQAPQPDFLQRAVGWFMQDRALGMLQTVHHFLAPAPAKYAADIVTNPALGGSCAVLRRAMLLEAGGIGTAPVTAQTHTARTLLALGYSHAYIGFSATEAFRVDQPFAGKTLLWKLRLLALHVRLQRYDAMARLIFLTAPVAYLLAELRFIQAPIEVWAAYALPHLLQHRLAQARMQGNQRFTTWIAVREALLAGYMLVRTALSVIRTELVFYKDRLQGALPEKADPFGWRITLPYVTVLALNLAGLIVGSARLPTMSPAMQALAVLCLFWSAYNLMLLAAQLAVAEEARHIQRHTRLQLRVPAMLKLPSGRSIFCMTENFPEAALELKLPTQVAMALDGPVNLSIFYGDREFLFPICVQSQQAMILRVTIKETAQADYRTLGIAVRSRGKNWPQWLPDRDADHPLPRWLSQRLVAMYGWTRAFATNFGPRMRGLASLARFNNGKKND